ncbi:MAG: Tn3 family transposase [Streptosporangiaceae bacterium]
MLSRGERRNSLARAVFHGQRGQLRRHYQVGQENQLDSLGIMINVIVLWQTVYIQAALGPMPWALGIWASVRGSRLR